MAARAQGVGGEDPTSPLSSAPSSRASLVVYEDDDDDPLAEWDPRAGSPRGGATVRLTALSGTQTGTHRHHTIGSRRGRWQWLRGKGASGDHERGDGDNIDEDDDDVLLDPRDLTVNDGGNGVSDDGGGDDDDHQPGVGSWRRWGVLLSVFLVFVTVHASRQMLAVLVPAGLTCVRNGEGNATAAGEDGCIDMNDAEIGVLLGPAFAIPFVVGGLPISWLADRHNRVALLAICAVGWSTALLGMAWADSFIALFLLRAALGVFEAGCNPCTYVMLSEHFPVTVRYRSTAFGLYHAGVYIGMGMSYFAGAASEHVGWRSTTVIYSALGYAVIATLMCVREHPSGLASADHAVASRSEESARPSRESVSRVMSRVGSPSSCPRLDRSDDSSIETPARLVKRNSLSEVTVDLLRCRPFCWLCAGAAVTMFCRFALAAYLPMLYERHYRMAPGDYGLYVGVSLIIGGSLSSAVGGWITDRLRTDTARGWVCALSQWLPLPFWLFALLSPTKEASLIVLFIAFLIGDAYLGVAVSMLQLAVPKHLRSRASMYYLGLNTLAGGFGPMAVGFLLEYSGLKLQASLATVVSICLPLSGVFFLLGGLSSDTVARKMRSTLSLTSLGLPMGEPLSWGSLEVPVVARQDSFSQLACAQMS